MTAALCQASEFQAMERGSSGARHQHRPHGAVGRREEGAAGAEHHGDGQQQVHRGKALPAGHGQGQDADHLACQAEQHHGATVIAVGGLAGGQGQQEDGDEGGQADHAHQEGGFGHRMVDAGQGVHLPAHGDALDLSGEAARPARGPEEEVIPLPQQGARGGDFLDDFVGGDVAHVRRANCAVSSRTATMIDAAGRKP
jgi:hypothetical protein